MPLKKLKEIIVAYSHYLYLEGSYLAHREGIEYPYNGPAFDFKPHQLIDNTEVKLPSGTSVPVHHGKFIEPKTNQVKGSFLKFKHWESKIRSAREKLNHPDDLRVELEIVTGQLVCIAVTMLHGIAETYSIPVSVPVERYDETVGVYDGYKTTWEHPECKLWLVDGRLESGNDIPADIQLKIEEFNDIVEQTKKEIEDIKQHEFRQAENLESSEHPSKQIIRLLQEIVIIGAQRIYQIQRYRALGEGTRYPYGGPIFLFTLDGNILQVNIDIETQKNCTDYEAVKNWDRVNSAEIKKALDALAKFDRLRRRLGSEIEENVYIIRKHLCPAAVAILGAVDDIYGFIPGDCTFNGLTLSGRSKYPGISNLITDLFHDDAAEGLVISGGYDDIPPGPEQLELKVEEFHFLLARSSRELNTRHTLAAIPSNPHGKESDHTLKSRSTRTGPKGPRKQTLERCKLIGSSELTGRELCDYLTKVRCKLPSRKLRNFYRGDWVAWFNADRTAVDKQFSRDRTMFRKLTSHDLA